MAYVFPRATPRAAAPLAETREGLALGPVLFGALLGAGLGVMLSLLLDGGLRVAALGVDLSLPFGAWCAGALAGALGGGLLSAWMGSDVGDAALDAHPEHPTRRNPIR